jgi:hypothetical protein
LQPEHTITAVTVGNMVITSNNRLAISKNQWTPPQTKPAYGVTPL